MYFVCETCEAKWFQQGPVRLCPRCGTIAAGEDYEAPWKMWAYDPKTLTTVEGHDILRRTDLDEAADRLWRAGIRNQRLMVDILSALSGPQRDEVTFTLQLSLPTRT